MSDRQLLPQRRPAQTLDLEFWNQPWLVTIGYYDNDMQLPGELFVNAGKKAGTDLDVMTRDASILFSLALQYGAPLKALAGALTRKANGKPDGIMGAIADQMLKQQKEDTP